MRVVVVAEGDATTPDCWSGSAQHFVRALSAHGIEVKTVDVEPRGWRRVLAAGVTFHPDRPRWRQRYALGGLPFALKSRAASRAVAASDADAVVQIGATFLVEPWARGDAPYVLYADSNVRYALRGAPFSGASRLAASEMDGVARREQRVYDAVERVWAMSAALEASFIRDFHQPADKLRVIYAGANNVPPASVAAPAPRGPVVLFIGKDHHRKGSGLLLDAFARVRQARPDAELHIVGAAPPEASRPGVFAHGFVSRRTPEGAATLDRLFARAAVFCMPSHYEPFGIAFVEAMLAGLPCIGTTGWAMPEIITDGETGWLVPPGQVESLAAALLDALADPARSAAMGKRGRERALARFTWAFVADSAARDLADLQSGRIGRRARRASNGQATEQ